MEPTGQELIARYKANYSIPADAAVTEQMILKHWELEKQLTRDLLSSTPQNRWEIFDRSYSRLYSDLEWLNPLVGGAARPAFVTRHGLTKWRRAMGASPLALYEIGSGRGELITYLAQQGFSCKGTEITRERGEQHLKVSLPSLSWGVSDGVHIERFERAASYDVVISDQVLEHLHPDDMSPHLRGVHKILKPGGRYIFRTPHRFSGPHDVSRVFNYDMSRGMHLKEYTIREVVAALQLAGYNRAYYAFVPFGDTSAKRLLGNLYIRTLMAVETVLACMPTQKMRRRCAKPLRIVGLFSNNISLIAERPSE